MRENSILKPEIGVYSQFTENFQPLLASSKKSSGANLVLKFPFFPKRSTVLIREVERGRERSERPASVVFLESIYKLLTHHLRS